jgi:hypothetical protein
MVNDKTLDVSSEFFFGTAIGILRTDSSEQSRRFSWAVDVGMLGIMNRIRMGKLAWLHYDPDYKKACKIVHNHVDALVEEAKSSYNERHLLSEEAKDGDVGYTTFLDALIAEGLGTEELRDQMLGMSKKPPKYLEREF